MIAHSLGFPRIGAMRQMKFALEAFWKGELDEGQLQEKGRIIRQDNWAMQAGMGLTLLPVGDFSWYDQVLDMSHLLGAIPDRYLDQQHSDLSTCFLMARGQAPGRDDRPACDMTKWFDTNYHYIMPELTPNQTFTLNSSRLFTEISEAHALAYRVKPVLIGPLTWLWLSKCSNKLSVLPQLLPIYQSLLASLAA